MTDLELERGIRRLLLEMSALEWEEEKGLLADIEFKPSRCYQCSMRRMLRNPSKWYKDRCRTPWQRAARMVASVALTITILFATIMVVSPTARAAVKNWLLKWYENDVEYSFADEIAQSDPMDYELTHIPEGYKEFVRHEKSAIKVVRYRNDAGKLLRFTCQMMEVGNAASIRTDDSPTYTVHIHEHNGEIYLSEEPSTANCIVWRDTEMNLQFNIYGFFDEETLTDMAESVKFLPPP